MRFLFIVLLAFTLVRLGASCDNRAADEGEAVDSEVQARDGEPEQKPAAPVAVPANEPDAEIVWYDLDRDLKDQQYDEIESADVRVRGNESRTIYTVDEDVLFAPNEKEIRRESMDEMEDIAASISRRYPQGRVYVYSHAEGEDDGPLHPDKAVQVKQWLVLYGKLDEARVFLIQGKDEPAHAPDLKKKAPKGVIEIVALNP